MQQEEIGGLFVETLAPFPKEPTLFQKAEMLREDLHQEKLSRCLRASTHKKAQWP